jgi:hypothetical protein
MRYNKEPRSRGQTQARAARESQTININERLDFSPAEFAALFGRSPTYGYRQLYLGRVKAISDAGRILIPRSEVERFLARAGEYNPQSKSTGNEKGDGGEGEA